VSAADLRVEIGDRRVPFSAGLIIDGLQAAGADTDDALAIARDVERELRRGERGVVPEDEVRGAVERLARARLGDEVAAVWVQRTPPFVPLTLHRRKGGAKRFSPRKLAGSLEALDLPFKEAWALAQQVEQGIRAEGGRTLSVTELTQRVALALEARYGREMRLRYEATSSRPADLMVREEDGGRTPYSRGILARSLTSIGLGPEMAHHLGKRVEEQLWRAYGGEVARGDVRRTVHDVLGEEAGEEFARRYDLMRVVRRPDRPIVVMIGGTAGVGKSEFAAELAYRLGIVRVTSTDAIRQALRSLIGADLAPVLHESSYTAWLAELLPEERASATPKRKAVVRGFQQQVLQLGTAIRAIVERNVTESTSLVMEGIHVVPGVSHAPVAGAVLVELMLVVGDEHVHRERFSLREGRTGARRPRAPYVEHFGEIRMVQRWLERRAAEADVPVLDVADLDDAADRAVEYVLDVVLAARSGDAPDA
jgi:2-phosphoglycerate kinase